MISRYTLPEMGRIWSDEHRLDLMLRVELLVLAAQTDLGIVPKKALAEIRKRVGVDLKKIQQREAVTKHDVIAFIEHLEERIGPYGRYLHFGLTSSDVLDTSLAAVMNESSLLLIADLEQLLKALATQAKRHQRTLMVGRTHGIHAEPTTFGLKLAVIYDELKRHLIRLGDVREEVAVGKISGAVGTFANVDPKVERHVCQALGIGAAAISTQIVQRDRHALYLTTLALIGASLEQLATEIRNLQRTEFQEVEEPFGKGQKGSSAMPHKKNPIACERVAGMARLLRGYALAGLENVAVWHERDITHSSVERVILPDASITLDYMLQTMTWIIEGLVVKPNRMLENLAKTHGVVFSGQVLLRLMEQGLSRTAAYELVQHLALRAFQERTSFPELVLQDLGMRRYLSEQTLRDCVNPQRHLRHVETIFKRVGLS